MDIIKFEELGENRRSLHITKEAAANLTRPDSQFMFHRLVEKGYSGIFMADVRGYLFYLNHAFVVLLGYKDKNDILGGNLADILFKDAEERTRFLEQLNKTGFVKDYDFKFIRKDGIDAVLSVTAHFSENKAGKIIGISSVHEVIPWAGHVNYAASKGGVKMLNKSIAQEVAPYRIRVNSVAPGAIRTPINQSAWETPEVYNKLMNLVPYKRIGEPEDIARTVTWLASDDADYITGVSLFVDGGMTLYPGFAEGG